MIDILIPNDNELELIEMAKRLDYKKLLFLYEKIPANLNSFQNKGIEVYPAVCIKNSFNGINKNIISVKNGREKLREFFEAGGKLAYGLETDERSDSTYFRNSGFDQVVGRMARENNCILCFSFSQILNPEKYKEAALIGRIKQNIRFCKKFKVRCGMFSFAKTPFEMRARGELDAFSRVLRMDQLAVKEGKAAVLELIEKVCVRKEGELPEGLRSV